MEQLVIIGAGGFGREVHDVVLACNRDSPRWSFLGFVDDVEPDAEIIWRRGAAWIGSVEDLPGFKGSRYAVGVGDAAQRRRLAHTADAAGLRPAILRHPSSTTGEDVEIGGGSIVCSHASMTTNIRIGRHVHVDQNVTIGHDVRCGNFARMNPGATISGNVMIGEESLIGAGATVVQGVRIGARAVVGAGAVVLADVAPGSVVVGVPARPLLR